MRGIGDELVLRAEQRLEPRDGVVELRRKRTYLGRPAIHRRPRLEIAFADGGRRLLERRERLGQRPRERSPTTVATARTTPPIARSSSQ